MTTGRKLMAAASYLSWLIFLIMYLVNKDNLDEFMKTHFNQAFMLNAIATVITILGKIGLGIVSTVGGLFLLVFLIWGIIYALTGSSKKIPVLSAVEFFK